MLLQDVENDILSTLQQSKMVNFGGAPAWGAFANPDFNQATVDYHINRGYIRLYSDIGDIQDLSFTTTFLSTLNGNSYALPPTGNPAVRMLQRVYYTPVGLTYKREKVPGVSLVSWQEFQRYTSNGYLRANAFGTEPIVCAVAPDRKTLEFYPGASAAGDTVTIVYAPIPTAGTTLPLLINPTDAPNLPDDCQEALVFYALSKLWPRAREHALATEYYQRYLLEVQRMKDNYMRSSAGDGMRFTDRAQLANLGDGWYD